MKPYVSPSTVLTLFQSVFSPISIMTASITIMTAGGGLGKVLISTIAAFSRFLRAYSLASSSGLAAFKSASASSDIALASTAFLFTISASYDTTRSFSFAIFLSAFTRSRAIFKSSFFFYKRGYNSVNLTLSSAIDLFVSLSFLRPVASLTRF
jgi:hypothetical protein